MKREELNGHGTSRPALIRTAESEVIASVKAALKQQNKSSWEVADGYAELANRGWSQTRIAQEFGTSQANVSYYLACARRYHLGDSRPPFSHAYDEVKNKPVVEDKPKDNADGGDDCDWGPDLDGITQEDIDRLRATLGMGPPPDSLKEQAAAVRQRESEDLGANLEHVKLQAADLLKVRQLVSDDAWPAWCAEAGLTLDQADQYLAEAEGGTP